MLASANGLQTRDEASKQLEESKKSAEAQWNAAQKQYQKATPANQKASKKTWDLAQKARDEVKMRPSPIYFDVPDTSFLALQDSSVVSLCSLLVTVRCLPVAVPSLGACMCPWRFPVCNDKGLLVQANKRLSQAEKELAKAFDHARASAERRSNKEEL